MTKRENLLSLYRRKGFKEAPVCFNLCPELEGKFAEHHPEAIDYREYFQFPMRFITDPGFPWIAEIPGFVPARTWAYGAYYDPPIVAGARMDIWGVAHEPGGPESKHMTQMRHPLERMSSVEEFEDYPWPDFENADWSFAKREVERIQSQGLAAQVWMECTIWEVSWYLRRMDLLMMEMAAEDDTAFWLLDKVTDLACFRAKIYAQAGADILALGDDLGMQSTLLMSQDMYRAWIKPRLKRVIDAAKSVKPDIIIQYHSCGYVLPLIGDLIEVGIDVLNPVQPECMDFAEVLRQFGGRVSFNGTIGTQTTMPFATPEEVKAVTRRNLELAGEFGGLLCCPTHMLEPEVPWENIEAYVEACREWRG
ncbi:MAG: uroporphyrinogen decarboxylase family protein [Verrucomicrobiota bacterium]